MYKSDIFISLHVLSYFHNQFVLPPVFHRMRAACFSNYVMKKNAIFAA